mmetsp:Transcript_131058/g.261470  ORF Transcript_131058/g.261470 Transcript_131058/m.261470 type:complete len:166 (-) Transcript_131058:25-522(-)
MLSDGCAKKRSRVEATSFGDSGTSLTAPTKPSDAARQLTLRVRPEAGLELPTFPSRLRWRRAAPEEPNASTRSKDVSYMTDGLPSGGNARLKHSTVLFVPEDNGALGDRGHRARGTGAPTVLNFDGVFFMVGRAPTLGESYMDNPIPPVADSRAIIVNSPHGIPE